LVSDEFEIAGEIFPVRHLSGDFFKVMELDSTLGLTVGDIAGKGLSAGIWQAHLMDLIQRCARACVAAGGCGGRGESRPVPGSERTAARRAVFWAAGSAERRT